MRHCNGRDIWVIVKERHTNGFRVYLVDENGFSPTNFVQNNIGSPADNGVNEFLIGYMKLSHSGNRLVNTLWANGALEIFDFDNSTGQLSNPVLINIPQIVQALTA